MKELMDIRSWLPPQTPDEAQIKALNGWRQDFPYCALWHLLAVRQQPADQQSVSQAALAVPDRRKLGADDDQRWSDFLKAENKTRASKEVFEDDFKKKDDLIDEMAATEPPPEQIIPTERIPPMDEDEMKFELNTPFEDNSYNASREANYFLEKFATPEAIAVPKIKAVLPFNDYLRVDSEQPPMEVEYSKRIKTPKKEVKNLDKLPRNAADAELAPQAKATFSSWLRQYKVPAAPTADNNQPPKPKEPQKPEASRADPPREAKLERKMKNLANKSISENDDVFSETLADLLSMQGQKTKAIEMFEKLILLFPEKSSYFANKIEKIKLSE